MPDFEEIAKNYADSLEEDIPGFKYDFANRKDFFFKVFFSFKLLKLDGNALSDDLPYGGAPGFTIDKKTLEAETISWGELDLLQEKQNELEEIYSGLCDAKTRISFLSSLKPKYDLNSGELLKLKKIIERTDFSKIDVIHELDALVSKNVTNTD